LIISNIKKQVSRIFLFAKSIIVICFYLQTYLYDGEVPASIADNSDFIEGSGLAFAELLAGLFDVSVEPHREKKFVPDKDDDDDKDDKKKKKKKKKQRL
jgi:hypothetical protein